MCQFESSELSLSKPVNYKWLTGLSFASSPQLGMSSNRFLGVFAIGPLSASQAARHRGGCIGDVGFATPWHSCHLFCVISKANWYYAHFDRLEDSLGHEQG